MIAAVSLAACKFGFEERTIGPPPSDADIDAAPDAPNCGPASHGDFATWPMPNFSAGLPHLASYTTSTDGKVVHDEVTRLYWMQNAAPTQMSQTDAVAYCESLNTGGACDWRLPERVELISISDYTRINPSFDATVLSGAGAVYWSATPVRNDVNRAWYVSFSNGVIERTTKTSTYAVRCVHGGAPPPPAHYTADASIVTDNGTGLVWERMVDVGSYNHDSAITRCANLPLAGGGWRSPSINELESIVDVTQVSPAIQNITFPSTPSSLFWSRNVQVSDMSQGWTVDFDQGTVARALTTALPVRCVR